MNAIATPWALFILEAIWLFVLMAGVGIALLALASLWTQRHSQPPT